MKNAQPKPDIEPKAGEVTGTLAVALVFKAKEGDEFQAHVTPRPIVVRDAIREIVSRWDWLDIEVVVER